MHQQPNEHGVYEPEYAIPIKIGKDGRADIELCETAKGWVFSQKYNSKSEGFGVPLTDQPSPAASWQVATQRAIVGLHVYFIGKENEKTARAALSRLTDSIPVLRIEDFKTTQEASTMTKTKKETNTQTEPAFKMQKIYLLARNPDGLVLPMDYSLPLTDMAKNAIMKAIDDGFFLKEIKEAEHQALVTASEEDKKGWPNPNEADHAAIKKLIDYELPHRLERSLSEYFETEFTPSDYKQLSSEFTQASSEKERITNNLKAYTQAQKAKLTELESTIKRVSEELSQGRRTESVRCLWVMNDPKRNVKSLYRLDREPRELVKTAPMLPSDKQLTIDDLAAQNAVKERTVDEKPVTEVENEPYEEDMMTDEEVAKEAGEE